MHTVFALHRRDLEVLEQADRRSWLRIDLLERGDDLRLQASEVHCLRDLQFHFRVPSNRMA